MCPALSVFKQHMRKFLFKAGAFLFDVIQSLAGTCFLCCRTYCKLEVVNIVDLFMTMFVTAMFRFRVFYTWPFFLVLFFQCRMPIDEMDGCPG